MYWVLGILAVGVVTVLIVESHRITSVEFGGLKVDFG